MLAMDFTEQCLLILGMSLVTAIPRIFPLLLLSSRALPEPFMRWLEMVPPAVLAALLAQEIFLIRSGDMVRLNLHMDNLFLWATVPTVLVGCIFNNFFATVATGLGTVALLRYCFF